MKGRIPSQGSPRFSTASSISAGQGTAVLGRAIPVCTQPMGRKRLWGCGLGWATNFEVYEGFGRDGLPPFPRTYFPLQAGNKDYTKTYYIRAPPQPPGRAPLSIVPHFLKVWGETCLIFCCCNFPPKREDCLFRWRQMGFSDKGDRHFGQ